MARILRLSELRSNPDFIIQYRTPFLRKFGMKLCTPAYYNVTWRPWAGRPHGWELEAPWKTLSTLCELCKNACCGCSWSEEGEPVPGWKAEPTAIHGMNKQYIVHSYCVYECPLFEPGRGRPQDLDNEGCTLLAVKIMEKALEDYVFDVNERVAIEHYVENNKWISDREVVIEKLRQIVAKCDENPELKKYYRGNNDEIKAAYWETGAADRGAEKKARRHRKNPLGRHTRHKGL